MNSLSIDTIEEVVIKCTQKVRHYLASDIAKESSVIVGYNPYGDASKLFDIEAEKTLVKCLVDGLNDVTIVSEETGVKTYGSGRLVVIIDPIDGSTNFESDIPWYAISVAVGIHKDGEANVRDIIYASVTEVARNRIYVYRDGEIRIYGAKATRRDTPKGIVLGYFDSPKTLEPLNLYVMHRGGPAILRILGSAALDIISVGLGNAEVFIDVRNKLRNLDIAAALRIALTMGAEAYIPGFSSPLDIPIDRVLRVSCVVGFNREILRRSIEVLRQIGLLG